MAAHPSWLHGRFSVSWCVDHIYPTQLMQEVLVIAAVIAAVFFIGRMIYRQFFAQKSGCESCGLSK
jgi:hypothetical protein